mgnify:CR=1 FL=1
MAVNFLTALTAFATLYGAVSAKKAADKARKAGQEASRQAAEQAKAALEESQKMREEQTGYFASQLENQAQELQLLTDQQATASAERQKVIDAYNSMVDIQRQQFQTAQTSLQQETARYEEQRAEAEKREAALQTEIEERRRKEVQEEQASARARRLRGGMRGLLSQTRLNPELGIKSAQTTLGA